MTVEEIRATIERYAAAWARGDLAETADCYHDEFTLHYSGANALSGDHVGKAASLAALAELRRRTQRQLLAVVATMSGRERGAIVARERFEVGDETVEVERHFVFAVRDGRLTDCWVYEQDQALVDRLIGAD